MVVRAIGKIAESYSDKNKRDSQHFFKPHGAIVYDDRILSIKSIDTVSILTLDGRIFVPIAVCEYHSSIINNALRVRGQTDLGYIDGKYYSGAKVKNLRRRNFKLRQKLQAKRTKSAKRLLKRRRRKESRFATDVNHCISKRLVQVAKGTHRAFLIKNLEFFYSSGRRSGNILDQRNTSHQCRD